MNKNKATKYFTALVNILAIVSSTYPGYVIAGVTKRDLVGELKFGLEMINFSLNRSLPDKRGGSKSLE